MAQDKNGKRLWVGDEIVVRARIKEIAAFGIPNEGDLLLVEWDSEAPISDYIFSSSVESLATDEHDEHRLKQG